MVAEDAPFLYLKILVWQSSHLYIPMWNSWSKKASPRAVFQVSFPGLRPGWHLPQSPVEAKASLPLWQAPQVPGTFSGATGERGSLTGKTLWYPWQLLHFALSTMLRRTV